MNQSVHPRQAGKTLTDQQLGATQALLAHFRSLTSDPEPGPRTWADVVHAIQNAPIYPRKEDCPLISGAHFGAIRSKRGSLRHTDNVTHLTALVGDYDAGKSTMLEAAQCLQRLGIRAVLYSTARHTQEAPRFRIVVALSKPVTVEVYGEMMSKLNGALGGTEAQSFLAAESWTAAQAFYLGRVNGVAFDSIETPGQPIDLLPGLTPVPYPHRASSPRPPAGDLHLSLMRAEAVKEWENGRLPSALRHIGNTYAGYAEWRDGLGYPLALLKGSVHEDEARQLFVKLSAMYDGPVTMDPERMWESLNPSGAITVRTVFDRARRSDRERAKPVPPPPIPDAAPTAPPGATPSPPPSDDPLALDWDALPEHPEPPKWVIPGWMIEDSVTLFSAHGGTGKSFLSLYIGLCLASGQHPFAHERIPPVKVVIYSAEDGVAHFSRRLRAYMRLMGITAAQVRERLMVLDATRSSNVLYNEHGTTSRFDWLKAKAASFGAQVVIFDNASDGLDASENDRAKVRGFMTALARLASSVLLLAHVDAASSMASPEEAKGYSGSTAWNNSARSRWAAYTDRLTGDVKLTLAKANYARTGAEVTLRWCEEHHVFRVADVIERARKPEDYRELLLSLAGQAIDAGVNLSPAQNSRNSVFNAIRNFHNFPAGLKSSAIQQEVSQWLSLGLMVTEPYIGPDRHTRLRLRFAAGGSHTL